MDRTAKRCRPRQRALALACTILLGSIASAAAASPAPGTKLVRCGAQSCLRVTGHREDPSSIVSINGREVPVEGGRRWTASLPVAVVREWSAPNARTIEVSLGNPERQRVIVASVDLPIGLLANQTDLAALVINVH